MIRVLFICLGNICRSPMAEAIFRHIVTNNNLQDQFTIDSAGLGTWHIGNPPHQGTRKILDEKQISYEGQKARKIEAEDGEKFDYIIAMDQQNIDELQSIRQKHPDVVVKKLLDFVPDAKEANVPDPYFAGNFDYTYELVEAGCQQLFNYIEEQHHLDD
ncbi:low molecular weight phosphotyrosine protein [Gracilibacillus halophilus YIM-C55.5]|uniref:protein-tyrosine-phosphatase n=1 Tax=Gracilibacillus halophilus YIM-C55.5 TaxID=1308866 RepID=N4W5Y4_9BACI|nr:low molecular weight protein-tyrosine-phosphatase [Gracilibacillus halophilus]ENH95603.1 low molecular weight phosphotyrosine protein [Gracilibacillus halophilus YIM-C55.5]